MLERHYCLLRTGSWHLEPNYVNGGYRCMRSHNILGSLAAVLVPATKLEILGKRTSNWWFPSRETNIHASVYLSVFLTGLHAPKSRRADVSAGDSSILNCKGSNGPSEEHQRLTNSLTTFTGTTVLNGRYQVCMRHHQVVAL